MSDMTANAGQPPEEKKNRGWLWLILLLLLLVAGAVAYYFWTQKQPPAPDGSFRTEFKSCDAAGSCATFVIYAPGFRYAWEYDKSTVVPLDGGAAAFKDKIADDLRGAKDVIVTGLASQEGSEGFNRVLAACRANAFEGIVRDVQAEVGGSATIYRTSLGRYQGDVAVTAASGVATDGKQTQRQRLMIMAFVMQSDPNVDLADALLRGAEANLGAALQGQLPDVAQQLDFTKYSCWGDAFRLTVIGDRMTGSCAFEPASCADFE